MQYQIAEPPGYKTRVLMAMYKYQSGKRIILDSFKEYKLNARSQATYRGRFNDTGHFRLVCVGHLIDTIDNFVKSDTTHNDFFISR